MLIIQSSEKLGGKLSPCLKLFLGLTSCYSKTQTWGNCSGANIHCIIYFLALVTRRFGKVTREHRGTSGNFQRHFFDFSFLQPARVAPAPWGTLRLKGTVDSKDGELKVHRMMESKQSSPTQSQPVQEKQVPEVLSKDLNLWRGLKIINHLPKANLLQDSQLPWPFTTNSISRLPCLSLHRAVRMLLHSASPYLCSCDPSTIFSGPRTILPYLGVALVHHLAWISSKVFRLRLPVELK